MQTTVNLMPSIRTDLAGIPLANPLMLASGIMDEDRGSLMRMMTAGAGAIVTKSIGLKARTGYANPTVIEVFGGIINAMGLPNPGIKQYQEELKNLSSSKTPIIGSIYGRNAKEFRILGVDMQKAGVHALELNLSCPHAKGYGLEIGSDPTLVRQITHTVKQAVDLPVFVKLSPNVTDITAIGIAAEKAGADGVVAINTIKAMKIDIETRIPLLSNKIGGYSGRAIKPVGIRCIYELKKALTIPLIGVGGIESAEDVVEYLLAGASAVQIGTALYTQEIEVFSTITKDLLSYMKTHHISTLSEIIGASHQ